MNKRKIGDGGEAYAARLLEKKGYRIVKRNFVVRGGEIDLIAENGEYLVFFEVKYRKTKLCGTPAQALFIESIRCIEQFARVGLFNFSFCTKYFCYRRINRVII